MGMDIYLDGGEIALIKAIGIGCGAVSGNVILDRLKSMDPREAMEIAKSLIDMGFILCDRDYFNDNDDFIKAEFHVNPGYSKALKQAIDPEPASSKPKRIRRE